MDREPGARKGQATASLGVEAARAAPAPTQPAFVLLGAGTYRLQAPLRFATVPALRPQGVELIGSAAGKLTLDLSAVPSTDSAGLALLVDWLSSARAAGKILRYAQASAALLALARLSEVEPLLMA